MRDAWHVAAVGKEVRALLPLWLAAMAAGAASLSGDASIALLTTMACGLGAVVLGAEAIGFEYRYRTFDLLMAQPVNRTRQLAVKLGVLAVLLAALAAMIVVGTWADSGSVVGPQRAFQRFLTQMLVAVPLLALFVAPALTLLCRSTLGGAIFTICLPILAYLVADLSAVMLFDAGDARGIDDFKAAAFWPAVLTTCAAGAVATWLLFTRLEAVGTRGESIEIPLWRDRSTTSAVTRRHPLAQLARKELGLQQMAFVVAGVFVALWVGISLVGSRQSGAYKLELDDMTPIYLIYLGFLSMLVGALAAAEEQSLGTAPADMLLPIAGWKRWAVKASVAFALMLGLGVALPAILGIGSLPVGREGGLVVIALVLTALGLYVSTLSANGVAALVATIVVAIAIPSTVGLALSAMVYLIPQSAGSISRVTNPIAASTLAAPFVVLLLWLGMRNQGVLDGIWPRAARQALFIAATMSVLALIIGLTFPRT